MASNGDWLYIPSASPNSKYLIQAASAGDPTNARVLSASVIMAGTQGVRPAASAAFDGCLYLVTNIGGGTLFRCDGTAWIQVAPAVGKTLDAYKSSDQMVVGSTTLQNDSALSVSLDALAAYYFRAFVPWTVPGGSPGIKLALGGTVTANRIRALIQPGTIGMNGFGQVAALGSALGTSSGSAEIATIEGTIETNVAGTLVVQWAQNSADATNGTTVERSAWLMAMRQ